MSQKPPILFRLTVANKRGETRQIHRLATTLKKAMAAALRLDSVSHILSVEEESRPAASALFGPASVVTRAALPVLMEVHS